jgi:hypothetical protein
VRINAKYLRRKYGSGNYTNFKVTLDKSNRAKLQELAPTGAGKYGSALVNLAIELLHAMFTGRGLGDVAQRMAGAVGNDEQSLYALAKLAMNLSFQFKVMADKVVGRLKVIEEE